MYLTSIIAVNNMTINKLNMTTNKIVCMIIILIIIFSIIIVMMVKTKTKKERFTKAKDKSKTKNKREKLEKIIGVCNNILVGKEHMCNCTNKDGTPGNDFKSCKSRNKKKLCNNYHVCKKFFKMFLSGSEPKYEPEKWAHPLIKNSHNCYAYFLNDKIPLVKERCRKLKNNCDTLKPQPGSISFLKGMRKSRNNKYTCDRMIQAVLDDNKPIEMSKFDEKCKKGYYKGYMVVDRDHTYHFYRQDDNLRWSHKQGTLSVENGDAMDKPIYVPHLSDKNYNKEKNDDGINYNDSCAYMCIPSNKYFNTRAI